MEPVYYSGLVTTKPDFVPCEHYRSLQRFRPHSTLMNIMQSDQRLLQTFCVKYNG